MTKLPRPGGVMASRPLHLFWLLDCSSSMAGNKIQSLNAAVRECLPAIRDEADHNPEAELLVRVITFSSGAQWHTADPTPVRDFRWTDAVAGGTTDLGHALTLLADALDVAKMGERALPPVLLLITDGQPTDDYKRGLKKLMEQPWARKATRVGIAIGSDADLDPINEFMAHPEMKALEAHNAPTLTRFIKWASTAVVRNASMPVSSASGAATTPLPTPPTPVAAGDVW